MKKSYAKLFVLVPFVTLVSCKKTESEKNKIYWGKENRISVVDAKGVDTFRVTGVYDYRGGRMISCVDNQGKEDCVAFDVLKKGSPMRGGEFIERGDTVVLKGDTLVENITRERIKSEFVKVKS